MPTRPVDEIPPVDELLTAAVEHFGGQPREGQRQMANAIAATIDEGRHLLVQAGTGTGKSLGYLIPLVARAFREHRPVVVSTATLALQSQLVRHELPRLADALEPLLGRTLTFGLVKGRANYLCAHKLGGGFPTDGDDALFSLPELPGTVVTAPTAASRLGREMVRLREWGAETETGDRDDLTPGVSDRGWGQVSVSARECLGGKCPLVLECFCELAREQARDVDVVVTNHALLAIDAFEGRTILPEYCALVVDEAHELADRVTSAVSGQLSATMVTIAANRASKNGGADASRLSTAAEDLTDALADLEPRRYRSGLPDHVVTVLEMTRDAARSTLSSIRSGSSAAEGSDGGVQQAKAAVQEVMDLAERLVEGRDGDVIWFEVSEFGNTTRRVLNVAPLEVSGLLAGKLFEVGEFADESERVPVILTSATLTVGGSFDPVAGQLGLSYDAESWTGLDVGSPFDYPAQGILYVPSTLPRPSRDGLTDAMIDEIAALVEAAGGRTLGLFSSRRAAQRAAEVLRERLDVPILCQGEDVTANLVRAFAADESTCLFGTLSLWQGVDVPGSACQLVIVDRIPFPRPDDPLMSARSEAVDKRGGSGFMSVSVHHASLRLAQGAGRLIRTGTDRGVVAVLDTRLVEARYGTVIQRSLPPMWRTRDHAVVTGALKRLDGSN